MLFYFYTVLSTFGCHFVFTADFALPERDFGYSMAGLPGKCLHINDLACQVD
jgi:hypothetical protein